MVQGNTGSQTIAYGNVQDAVADRLREMITLGQLKSGSWLRQEELAETFGVSTMPVREALRKLEAEGLVVFHARRGATVAQPSLEEFEEIFRIREVLEILACRWAAEDFSRINIQAMGAHLERLTAAEESMDVKLRMEELRSFFFVLFESSNKQHLIRIVSSFWDLSQQYRRSFSFFQDTVPVRLQIYRNIYDACVRQDEEGLVAAFQSLYAFVRSALIPYIKQQQEQE